MNAWIKSHFRDEQRARETLAAAVVVAALVGLGVVAIGIFLSSH
ncbi:hypothetical protein [Pelomonas sp. BJYL3]|nr:hypothetical protein [Pelomonas sp. BJYL3]